AGLGGFVPDEIGKRGMPRRRAEVHHRGAAGALQTGCDGLRRKEVVTQIDCDAFVPVFRRDVLDTVTIVVRGVVHEHCGGTCLLFYGCESSFERTEVPQIAFHEARPRSEERRVGKEGGSRWSRTLYRKRESRYSKRYE